MRFAQLLISYTGKNLSALRNSQFAKLIVPTGSRRAPIKPCQPPAITDGKITRQTYNRIIENLIKRFSNSREISAPVPPSALRFENEQPRMAGLFRQSMLAIGRESGIA